MNNSTISVFSSAYSFDSVWKSFDLKYTKTEIEIPNRSDCFSIIDTRDVEKKV
jgi:hypothetical protein